MKDRIERIMQSIRKSPKKVKVLSVNEDIAGKIASGLEIDRDSLLGTIVYYTGGIIVDDWIRIYGAGRADFYQRNQDFPYDHLLVAEDILGGLYAMTDEGTVGYFAPDTLEWEDNGLTYPEFLYWCLHGDTDLYYKDYRWRTWEKDVAGLSIENGMAFYPFLWADGELEERSRKEIPM